MGIVSHIGNTVFRMYQKPFSRDWDKRLNEVIEHGKVVRAGEHTIEIQHNGIVMSIWTSNRWYSFGNLHYINGKYVPEELQFRPRFKTMEKLWELYQRERSEFLDSEYKNLFNNTPAR